MYKSNQTSSTQQQLHTLAPRLGMTTQAIERDLALEKSDQTRGYLTD